MQAENCNDDKGTIQFQKLVGYFYWNDEERFEAIHNRLSKSEEAWNFKMLKTNNEGNKRRSP